MTTTQLARQWNLALLGKETLELRWSRGEESKRAAEQLVAKRLGRLRGLPQKVGQMIGFSAEQDSSSELQTLYESAQPLPWHEIAPQLEIAWTCSIDKLFSSIDPNGKAASLGQVHQAQRHDGREVAIKIQFPDVATEVENDLKKLGWLAAPFGNLNHGFDLQGYRKVIRQSLQHELDYQQEARSQIDFFEGLGQLPFVVVPQLHRDLSTASVLVSDWEDGDTWNQVTTEWSEADKQQLASRILEFSLRSLFEYQIIHADLHPGNIRFRRTEAGPVIVLYDFGSIYRISDQERDSLLRWVQTTRSGSGNLLPCFRELGFDSGLLRPIVFHNHSHDYFL